jgi:hypothetical protein
MGDLAGAAGGGETGGATGGKTGIGTAGCEEGLTASAPVEILRGRRLSGSSARDAASWVLIVVGAGPDVVGAGLGAAGGVFGAAVAGLGEGDGSGVGGTEAADGMAPGGIDG